MKIIEMRRIFEKIIKLSKRIFIYKIFKIILILSRIFLQIFFLNFSWNFPAYIIELLQEECMQLLNDIWVMHLCSRSVTIITRHFYFHFLRCYCGSAYFQLSRLQPITATIYINKFCFNLQLIYIHCEC